MRLCYGVKKQKHKNTTVSQRKKTLFLIQAKSRRLRGSSCPGKELSRLWNFRVDTNFLRISFTSFLGQSE